MTKNKIYEVKVLDIIIEEKMKHEIKESHIEIKGSINILSILIILGLGVLIGWAAWG
jgi:predicted negative regulator of RcsB-dependent stress response